MLKNTPLPVVPKEGHDAIMQVNDPAELREAALRALAGAGMIVRTQDEFDTRLLPQAVTDQSMPANGGYRCERTIRFHESTGRRALVIKGNSQADLDALEHEILYGGSR